MLLMNSGLASLKAALVASLFLAPAVGAFELIPMVADLDPAGRKASHVFRLENDSTNSIAVQISIVSRQMDLTGEETHVPATNDFTIFPPQAVLRPKSGQSVRVSYVGKSGLTQEASYRIIAEQLPVALSPENSGGARVKLLLRYSGAIYVVPRGAKPELLIESVIRETDTVEKAVLAVTVHNRGTAHTLIDQPRLHLTVGEGGNSQVPAIVLEAAALPGLNTANILAGAKRRFLIPQPESLPPGPVQGRLEFTVSR